MKLLPFSPVLIFVISLLAPHLVSCSRMPPAAPGSANYTGESEAAYRRGYHHGAQDGRRKRDSDYERYYYEYRPQTEKAFEQGYDLGYESGEDQAEASESDRDAARNQGYDAGRSDCENGQAPDPQRHRRYFTLETEGSFTKGYLQGYKEGREALEDD